MDVNCYKYINLEYMDMMSDGDDSMKKIMLEMLLEELPEEIQKLENQCQQNNWTEVGAVSHKLKSTLAFVGNEEMTNSNKDIESLAKNPTDVAQIPGLIDRLKMLYPKTIEELNLELQKL